MLIAWINRIFAIFIIVLCTGCASSLEGVTNPDAPNMKQVYEDYTGTNTEQLDKRQAELLQRPALHDDDLQLELPPYPARLDHLYPRLPNPDLFMYVRPHAVGLTGAPIPAYITRFSMYDRQPYALPGETLDAAKIVTDHRVKKIKEREDAQKKEANKSQPRELFHE